jgi:hypothetical protein
MEEVINFSITKCKQMRICVEKIKTRRKLLEEIKKDSYISLEEIK